MNCHYYLFETRCSFQELSFRLPVGRDKSIKLIKDAYAGDKMIGVIAQLDQTKEEPSAEHLYEIGTIAKILKMLKMPDGSSTIIIQGYAQGARSRDHTRRSLF